MRLPWLFSCASRMPRRHSAERESVQRLVSMYSDRSFTEGKSNINVEGRAMPAWELKIGAKRSFRG